MTLEGNNIDLAVVILAGGAGQRFWPMGTEDEPKQLIKLFGGKSLLEMSGERALALAPPERILVLTNAALADKVRGQLLEIPAANVIGEPLRKDTAAAIGLAAVICRRRFNDPVMAVLTADHLVEPLEEFKKAIMSAAHAAADSDALYTFGVKPTYPAIGYGYLERGEKVASPDQLPHHRLLCFKEKPDLEKAKSWLNSGRHFWNSGMFVWKTSAIGKAIEKHLPDHFSALAPLGRLEATPAFPHALREAFEKLSAISIDHGVMEHADDVRMIEAGFDWSDVGGWASVWEFLERDADENAVRGRAASLDAHGNLIFCEDENETVAVIGVHDLVVIRAGSRTLVAPRDRAEEIKKLMDQIKDK